MFLHRRRLLPVENLVLLVDGFHLGDCLGADRLARLDLLQKSARGETRGGLRSARGRAGRPTAPRARARGPRRRPAPGPVRAARTRFSAPCARGAGVRGATERQARGPELDERLLELAVRQAERLLRLEPARDPPHVQQRFVGRLPGGSGALHRGASRLRFPARSALQSTLPVVRENLVHGRHGPFSFFLSFFSLFKVHDGRDHGWIYSC